MDDLAIRNAFSKAKQDISDLAHHLLLITQEIQELKSSFQAFLDRQTDQQTNRSKPLSSNTHFQQTEGSYNQAFPHKTPSNPPISFNTPADKSPLYGLKVENIEFSIGNKGVPADRQTNRPADQRIGNEGVPTQNPLKNASELIDSLDSIKQEVRFNIKNLTKQEFLIFSTIYQLEEEGFLVDYPLLSKKLSLTESSIRDYIQKLYKKGIPLQKLKKNNKKVYISVSNDLKKMASLPTILSLREP